MVTTFQFVLQIAAVESFDILIILQKDLCLDFIEHNWLPHRFIRLPWSIVKGFHILHTFLRLLRKDWADFLKQLCESLNCFLVGSKMNRQFSVSFASEFTSRQRCRSTENRTSTLSEFQEHPFFNFYQIPCGLFSSIEDNFISAPGPINNHCPVPNFRAYREWFPGSISIHFLWFIGMMLGRSTSSLLCGLVFALWSGCKNLHNRLWRLFFR